MPSEFEDFKGSPVLWTQLWTKTNGKVEQEYYETMNRYSVRLYVAGYSTPISTGVAHDLMTAWEYAISGLDALLGVVYPGAPPGEGNPPSSPEGTPP